MGTNFSGIGYGSTLENAFDSARTRILLSGRRIEKRAILEDRHFVQLVNGDWFELKSEKSQCGFTVSAFLYSGKIPESVIEDYKMKKL